MPVSGKRYPEEFTIEAVKQVVDHGLFHRRRCHLSCITPYSLYAWVKKYGPDSSATHVQSDNQSEKLRLQIEL